MIPWIGQVPGSIAVRYNKAAVQNLLPQPARTVCLVMCSAEKACRPTRAADLYSSQRFQADRAYAEHNFDTWYILSGKHGLLSAETVVEPYDFDLNRQTPEYRQQWAKQVATAISVELLGVHTLLEIRADSTYESALLPFLLAYGFSECRGSESTNVAVTNDCRLFRAARIAVPDLGT